MAENTAKKPLFSEEDHAAKAQRCAACICLREKTTIKCSKCGHLSFGRKFRICPSHRNVFYLYDSKVCSQCRSSSKDLEELPIDYETFQKLVLPARLS